MRNVGLLGAGAIGMAVVEAFERGGVDGHRLTAVLARPHQIPDLVKRLAPSVLITSDEPCFMQAKVDLVIEAAGHQAAAACGPDVLRQGRDFYLMSSGVLADATAKRALLRAAREGDAKIVIPSGGLAGFDGLRALALLDPTEVTYISTKPPHAWSGTPGEAIIRRHGRNDVVVVFEGNAAQAALNYPKNANLAAAVAFAGIGLERTRVRLVSDPTCTENTGSVIARSRSSTLELTMSGSAFADNPKSSKITSASIVAALLNDGACIKFS